MQRNFCVCIPTYQRPALLLGLIHDLTRQTALPGALIVVDGDAGSGETLQALQADKICRSIATWYIPSNHANLPYQRYLGWLAARRHGHEVILYLDDDLRAGDPMTVERLVQPLLSQVGWSGGTAVIEYSLSEEGRENHQPLAKLVDRFGAARDLSPGELTPTGIRAMPEAEGDGYAEIHWLHGGVMALRVETLERGCFLEEVFAVYERKIGKGEDTILSRRVNSMGKLYIALDSTFEHGEADSPKAYPTAAYRQGYAFAYSRRLINDQYRGMQAPTVADRLALVKSYAGTTLLHWFSAMRKHHKSELLFALGYSAGALRGLVQRPSAAALTPGVDWQADAEEAIHNIQKIGEPCTV